MGKKLVSLTLVLTFAALFTFTSAHAGSRERLMWKGAGIALGTLALGGLVAHHIYTHSPRPPVVYYPPPEPYYCPPRPEYIPGHWEIVREWAPRTWDRDWDVDRYRDRDIDRDRDRDRDRYIDRYRGRR